MKRTSGLSLSEPAVPADLKRRIADLEASQELYEIYMHPNWVKLVHLIESILDEEQKVILREWAESHPYVSPLIERFHRCTESFGLSFDIYTFRPLSRLVFDLFYHNQIEYHTRMIREHCRMLNYYKTAAKQLEDSGGSPISIADPEAFENSTQRSRKNSCWSVMSDLNSDWGLSAENSVDEEDCGRSDRHVLDLHSIFRLPDPASALANFDL